MNKQELLEELNKYSPDDAEKLRIESEEIRNKKGKRFFTVKIILLAFSSLLVPVIGFVYGLINLNKKDKHSKIIGYTFIGLAAVSVLVRIFIYRYILEHYL